MLLNEVFDKKLPWEWIQQDQGEHIARFDLSDTSGYTVSFERQRGRLGVYNWSVSFERYEIGSNNRLSSSAKITGTGSQYAVFSTVVDIVKSFMGSEDPNQLMFTADKQEPSRVALYRRMVKMFPPSAYEVEQYADGEEEYFLVSKIEAKQHAA